MSQPIDPDQHVQEDNEEDEKNDSVYELVITNGKGYGLFATQSIPRGTRIVEESALITSPPPPSAHGLLGIHIEDLIKKLTSLPPKQHELYFDLYHDPKLAAITRVCIRQIQENRKHAKILPLSSAHDLDSVVKFYAIYQANFVRLGDSQKSGSGVFPTASRFNHSCIPNLHIYYVPEAKKLIAHAVRHINKGEELTIGYHSKVWRARDERNTELSRWGFECKCRTCNLTGKKAAVSEERRARMFEIEEELAAFDELHGYFANFNAATITPHQALELAEELLGLLKTEGIADHGLQSGYRHCSKYSLKASLLDKAVAYAKKERDVEGYCIGADTANLPHLAVDRKGAVPWLNFILSEWQTEVNKRKANEKSLKEIARESASETKKSGKSKKK